MPTPLISPACRSRSAWSLPRTARTLAVALIAVVLCSPPARAQLPARVASPDGRTEVTLALSKGRLTYAVTRDGAPLMVPGALGFAFRGAPTLRDSLQFVEMSRATHEGTCSGANAHATRLL